MGRWRVEKWAARAKDNAGGEHDGEGIKSWRILDEIHLALVSQDEAKSDIVSKISLLKELLP